jgi:two-component system, chemotaxis family, sensor histidine kinase and response regulator WspE
MNPQEDLSNFSMLELFRAEAENQTAILNTGLLELERGGAGSPQTFEALMRAAHSLKGAARIVNLQGAVRVAHALEDCFVAAQHQQLDLRQQHLDVLFEGVDLLGQLARCNDGSLLSWETDHVIHIDKFLAGLTNTMQVGAQAHPEPKVESAPSATARPVFADQLTLAREPAPQSIVSEIAPEVAPRSLESPERVVRLTAENLNRLLGLAGESLVDSRWLGPFAQSLQRLKRHQTELDQQLRHLRQALDAAGIAERTEAYFVELFRELADAKQFLGDRLQELDLFDRRSAQLSQRLYLEVLRTRMRPFSDGVRRFPRMVRDLARSLGKQVRFEIFGENTQVDRDILDRLEAPLAHLLRNAVDHGCESTVARQAAGKPAEGSLRLEARHSAGVLLVTVADDGAGVDLERVREAVVRKHLTTRTVAQRLSESELLEFLFLPGFTLKETVTELSGRGFGLDVVQNMIKSVRGTIRLINQSGRGLRVQLQLPLTLSVLRALLVEIGGEPYALPLNQITRTLKLAPSSVEMRDGRPYFRFGDQSVSLITAHQVLECATSGLAEGDLPVVILGDRAARFGIVVDRFLGERELVVQPLDGRLGKMRNISAAALMEDGAPVLIVDVEDLMRSIEKLLEAGTLSTVRPEPWNELLGKPKRVLVVDDSLTVRELERKLLAGRGYITEAAIDGMDAWNAVRAGAYDLIITDVDMPRLDGIQLTTRIKQDPRLKNLPVLIVSYKDREEDRLRGLEAGADYYLTKGSFHDETLVQAVIDLIGEARP